MFGFVGVQGITVRTVTMTYFVRDKYAQIQLKIIPEKTHSCC